MAIILCKNNIEIEVKENTREIKRLIGEKLNTKTPPLHFIDVTLIKTKLEFWGFSFGKSLPVPRQIEVKSNLDFTSILLIYD